MYCLTNRYYKINVPFVLFLKYKINIILLSEIYYYHYYDKKKLLLTRKCFKINFNMFVCNERLKVI